MSGDVHVRFCERLGVRFPRATRLVVCFQYEADARGFLPALAERLASFGLEVEPSKTAVLRFGSQAARACAKDGLRRPQTFSFLGITHFVSRSRRGRFVIGRKTEAKRFRGKLKLLNERLRRFRVEGGKAMMDYVRRHRQLLGIGRLAYPMHMKVTTCVLLGWKRHGCSVVEKAGGAPPEQAPGPQAYMALRRWERIREPTTTAVGATGVASKLGGQNVRNDNGCEKAPALKSLSGRFCGRRPVHVSRGRPTL